MNKSLVAIEDISPEKDHYLRVEWNLGKRCNFDCSYCGASTHDSSSAHLSWDVVEKTLRKLSSIGKRENKKVKIGLTGGEPYLHPRFLDLVRLAKELGIHRISVTTNGSVRRDLYEESMQYVDYLVVSYHLEYARRQKVVDNVIAIKKYIQEHLNPKLKHLHVHIMLLPGHFDEAQELMASLRKNDINYVLRRIRPQYDAQGDFLRPYQSGLLGQPRAKTNLTDTYYSPEELIRMESFT